MDRRWPGSAATVHLVAWSALLPVNARSLPGCAVHQRRMLGWLLLASERAPPATQRPADRQRGWAWGIAAIAALAWEDSRPGGGSSSLPVAPLWTDCARRIDASEGGSLRTSIPGRSLRDMSSRPWRQTALRCAAPQRPLIACHWSRLASSGGRLQPLAGPRRIWRSDGPSVS